MMTKQHATINNQWINKEIREEIQTYLERKTHKKTQPYKIYGIQQKQFPGKSWWAGVHGVAKSRTRLTERLHFHFHTTK